MNRLRFTAIEPSGRITHIQTQKEAERGEGILTIMRGRNGTTGSHIATMPGRRVGMWGIQRDQGGESKNKEAYRAFQLMMALPSAEIYRWWKLCLRSDEQRRRLLRYMPTKKKERKQENQATF